MVGCAARAMLNFKSLFHAVFLACLLGSVPLHAADATADASKSAVAPTDPRGSLASYKIGPNDKVRIDVYGEPDLTVDVNVEANGTINYPLLGRIRVTDMTAKDLEQVIYKGLSDGYLVKPDVRVSLASFRPIYVIGQVRRAGAYPYIEGINVEKALALAGGMTELASTQKIYILRENSQTYKREKVQLNTSVMPGDTIVIEEGWF